MIASDLFDFPKNMPFAAFFSPDVAPWKWVSQIKAALSSDFEAHVPDELPQGVRIEGKVFIDPSAKLPAFCHINGPAWIGQGVEIRPGAYIRGNAIIGPGSVLGNSCEFKNCLVLAKAQIPHFSYVGDSVLGNGAHLGAGVILSNLRLDQKPVKVMASGERVDTGMRKLGALIGDNAEIGCNSALNPGAILGRRSLIGPLVNFSGTLGAEQLCLNKQESFTIARRD